MAVKAPIDLEYYETKLIDINDSPILRSTGGSRQLSRNRFDEPTSRECQDGFLSAETRSSRSITRNRNGRSFDSTSSHGSVPRIKLPTYHDGDHMESYLIRFETVAKLLGIHKKNFPPYLASVLSNSALVYYSNLSTDIRSNYDLLHDALLRMNDGQKDPQFYRRQFKNCKPDCHCKKFDLHATNLFRNYEMWLETSTVTKNYDDLKIFMVLDQFISSLPSEIETFVRSRNPNTLRSAVNLANSFANQNQGTTASNYTEDAQPRLAPSREVTSPINTKENYPRIQKTRSGRFITRRNKLPLSKSNSKLGTKLITSPKHRVIPTSGRQIDTRNPQNGGGKLTRTPDVTAGNLRKKFHQLQGSGKSLKNIQRAAVLSLQVNSTLLSYRVNYTLHTQRYIFHSRSILWEAIFLFILMCLCFLLCAFLYLTHRCHAFTHTQCTF